MRFAIFALLTLAGGLAAPAAAQAPAVTQGERGLVYTPGPQGDRIIDFSHAGYGGGGRVIPAAPVRLVVAPAPGDDGARIQAAIAVVSGLAPDAAMRRSPATW